jgi:hypothetical protein
MSHIWGPSQALSDSNPHYKAIVNEIADREVGLDGDAIREPRTLVLT